MVLESQALPGRQTPLEVPARHAVLDTPMQPPFPADLEIASFALGCFWGAERRFYELKGVYTTAAGYAGGYTPNPSYEEVCTGGTGHAETVLVVFDPAVVSYGELLQRFFESHDPTQGMRQGNDRGTQYRSVVFTRSPAQHETATAMRKRYGAELSRAGLGAITTEIVAAGPFYYAEAYHQQYLAKNPAGYCGLGGTGVSCPTGVAAIPRD
jgi:peptide-methionine (S)-S-oxide reductase